MRIGSREFDINHHTYIMGILNVTPDSFSDGGSYHTLDPAAQAGFTALFQTGWFVESMWTQTLVIHFIRTARMPFVKSRASAPLLVSTFLAVGALTLLPFLPFGGGFGLTPLPGSYFLWLFLIVAGYLAAVTAGKKRMEAVS